ncbi:MAG: hypothetical protein ACK40L_08245 [Hydrogenophaga sp.]
MPRVQNDTTVRQWLDAQRVARVLVVSPHLDDAVLSLAEFLRCVSARARVLTVFSESDPQTGLDWAQQGGFQDAAEEHAARRLEDMRALQHLGCAYQHAGLRSGQLTATVLEQQLPGWLAAGSTPLSELLVLLPAGCGGEQPIGALERLKHRLLRKPFGSMAHPEHLLVRNLFWKALATAGVRLGFYAELPYAWRQTDTNIRNALQTLTQGPLRHTAIPPDVEKKQVAAELYRSQVERILGHTPRYRQQVLGRPESVFLVAPVSHGTP